MKYIIERREEKIGFRDIYEVYNREERRENWV